MLRSISLTSRRLRIPFLSAKTALNTPKKQSPLPLPPSSSSQHLITHHAFLRPSMRYFSTTTTVRAIVPFKLHDIGEGITEVEMLKWKVVVGQRVEHFDDLCEVQSDKSTAELTSPTPGIVHSINVQEGDTVKVGQTLCQIKTDEEGSGGEDPEPPVEAMVSEEAPTVASNLPSQITPPQELRDIKVEEPEKTTQTPEKSQESSSARRPRHALDDRDHDEPSSSSPSSISSTSVQFSGEASILPSAPPPMKVYDGIVPPRRERDMSERVKKIILSSPAVRAMAGRLGINLEDIEGSGEKGRITKDDIERFLKTSGSSSSGGSSSSSTSYYDSSSTQSSTSALPTSPVPPVRGKRDEWAETTKVDFGRTRKVMYRALSQQAEVPHFGYSHTLNLTPLIPYLKALNPPSTPPTPQGYIASDIPASLSSNPLESLSGQTKTTLLSLLVKGLLLAMEEHPVMRAKVMGKGEDRFLEVRKDGIIGVAVSDPKYGLVTPSLPALPPSTPLSKITDHLLTLRKNPTKPGPTANLVVSSVGGLGEARGAMPVIPPGGPLAICAVGQAKWDVEWVLRDGGMRLDPGEVEKGGIRPVLRCPVGWSGDHRVLEGAELIAFTESWKRYIEEPWRWLKVDG